MTTSRVIELIREHRALDLTWVGSFAGGEVGATDVRGADGTRYVLKWWPGTDAGSALKSAALVERLQRLGYPVPRYLLADVVGGVIVTVQEFRDGAASDDVSDSVVDELLALNELQATAAGEGDAGWVSTSSPRCSKDATTIAFTNLSAITTAGLRHFSTTSNASGIPCRSSGFRPGTSFTLTFSTATSSFETKQ
jgi:hypothetical protein